MTGDAPCWAHELDDEAMECTGANAVVTDLRSVSLSGRSGVVWSLDHGGDLDANLVHVNAGEEVGEHVNDEVDVLVIVQSGSGQLVVDGTVYGLRPDVIAHIHRGARRAVHAGPDGVAYLSIHRRRAPLTIGSGTGRRRSGP